MQLAVKKHREFALSPLGENANVMDVFALAASLLKDRMWVGAGTLLGIHRGDRIIPWDTDIDFMCVAHPETFGGWKLPAPFELIRTIDWGDFAMQRAYIKDDVIVDLAFFWTGFKDGLAHHVHDCGRIRMDPALAEPAVHFTWKGIDLMAPPDPAKWLAWWYGPQWREPRGSKGASFRDSACLERGWEG